MRAVFVAALVGATLAGTATAGAAPLRVRLPAPGHVTLGVAAAKAVKGRPLFSVRSPGALPPSVRVLTFSRKVRSGGRSLRVGAFLAVNRRAPVARAAGKGGDDDYPGLGLFSLLFLADEAEPSDPDRFLDFPPLPDPLEKYAGSVANAGKLSQAEAARAAKVIGAVVLRGDSPAGVVRGPSVEVDHYDDGHAFGWNLKAGEERTLWREVFADVVRRDFDELVATIEERAGVQLDGGASCSGSGESETPLTIPDGSEYVDVRVATPIPAGCDLSGREWSIVVHDANSPATIYFCKQGAGPPPGEQPCAGLQPAFPPDGDIIAGLAELDGAWQLTYRFQSRRPQTVVVRTRYSWSDGA